jgi:hypothetical protein
VRYIYVTSSAPDTFRRGSSPFYIQNDYIYVTSSAPDIFRRGSSPFYIQ